MNKHSPCAREATQMRVPLLFCCPTNPTARIARGPFLFMVNGLQWQVLRY